MDSWLSAAMLSQISSASWIRSAMESLRKSGLGWLMAGVYVDVHVRANVRHLFGAAFFAFTFDAFTCATAFAASIRP
jgi:hypothetical protein